MQHWCHIFSRNQTLNLQIVFRRVFFSSAFCYFSWFFLRGNCRTLRSMYPCLFTLTWPVFKWFSQSVIPLLRNVLEWNRKEHIASELLRGLYGAQWEAGEKRKLFTTGEDCLVHVKLWPAVHCLWCLSFNRLVDIMNEPDPPSATLERTPALSELRSTLEPLSQSGHSPVAKCRARKRKSRKLLFCSEFNEVGLVTQEGIKGEVSVTELWLLKRELKCSGHCVNRMVSVQSCTRRNMAGSPPALPGFGNSGKCFLIDNLLQSQTPSARPEGTVGGHLRLAACERPRRTWSCEHGAYQSQARSPQQVKDLGGQLLPHSGKDYHLNFFKQADFSNKIYLYYVKSKVMANYTSCWWR